MGKGGLAVLFEMVMGGLVGTSPHMISASVMALARLLHQFANELGGERFFLHFFQIKHAYLSACSCCTAEIRQIKCQQGLDSSMNATALAVPSSCYILVRMSK